MTSGMGGRLKAIVLLRGADLKEEREQYMLDRHLRTLYYMLFGDTQGVESIARDYFSKAVARA